MYFLKSLLKYSWSSIPTIAEISFKENFPSFINVAAFRTRKLFK